MLSRNIKYLFEEFIIIFLIFLNVFDFLKLLPTDVDFIKKIISWTILGYLIYHVSITKQVFGKRDKLVDTLLLVSFFLLIFKYILTFSYEITKNVVILTNLYNLILTHEIMITYLFFYIGIIMIFLCSIYKGIKTPILSPSFLHVIHGERIRNTFFGKMERITITFLIFLGFFLFIFNPMMEWLGLAVDASLIIIAIVFYLLTSFRRHFKKFNKDELIFKIGSFGEKFYKEFIELLHTKKGLFLISSGIICLHILSDIGNFVIPYFFGKNFLYLNSFDASHQSLNMLLADLILNQKILYIIEILIIYILNFIGIVSLLSLPSYIWYKFYKNKRIDMKDTTIPIVIISIAALIFTPIFHFVPIDSDEMIGMDIQSYNDNNDSRNNIISIGAYLLLGILIYLMSKKNILKKYLISLILIIANIFLGFYIYTFFIQNNTHYMAEFIYLLGEGNIFLSIIMLLFLLLNGAFYILGFIVFGYENIKEISKI